MPDPDVPPPLNPSDPSEENAELHEPPTDLPTVPEALIQDLWARQQFTIEDLATTEEKPVQILDPGQKNTDAGPDFQNAHVRIGDMDWRGHIELHNTSGGWFRHAHHKDSRYDSVILHVTLHPDVWTGELLRSDESALPELVLYPHLETPLRELLRAFHTRDDDALACASRWDDVSPDQRWTWIHHLAHERLGKKRDRLSSPNTAPLDTALHERLLAGLGYAKNDDPMSMLAQRTSPDTLRAIDTSRNREALLLGTAGLLPEPSELLDTDRATADYAMELRDRFRRLRVRLDVSPMATTTWTFFRLRPNNFPPLRIAQAASWYKEGALLAENPIPSLRTGLNAEDPVATLREALGAEPPAFWRTHYHLTKEASDHDPSLGKSRIDTLLVNAVAPVLLLDATHREDASQAEATVDLLRALPPSGDHVLRRFQALGTEADSAFDAQGLHELYRHYCTKGGCLDCEIGQSLLGR